MNRVCLQATKFVNHPQKTETFGYRIYDEYAQVYDNTLESLPDDDLDLLREAMKSDNVQVTDMIDFAITRGIEINGEWYEWEKISHLFDGVA